MSRWPLVRLGDFCDVVGGPSVTTKGDSLVPVVTSGCLTEQGFDPKGIKQATLNRRDLERGQVLVGDVLFSRSNTSELVGRVALFDREAEVYSSDLTYRLRPDLKVVCPGFLEAALRSLFVAGRWREAGGASGSMKKVSMTELRAENIALPLIDEQRRIVAELEVRLAAAVEAKARLVTQAEDLKKLAIRQGDWLVRGDGDHTIALSALLFPKNDIVHPKDSPHGLYTFTGLEHIERDTGRIIGSVTVDASKMPGRRARYGKGDLVYGYLRPYLNKVCVANDEGLCSVDQYVFAVDASRARPAYLARWMRSEHYLAQALGKGSSGQLPRIRTEEVLSTTIRLPSLKRQDELLGMIGELESASDACARRLSSQVYDFDALEAATLREAFA